METSIFVMHALHYNHPIFYERKVTTTQLSYNLEIELRMFWIRFASIPMKMQQLKKGTLIITSKMESGVVYKES